MNLNEIYLPIGTVVLLKDATKRLMIIGYGIIGENEDDVYDYSGCLYPEGLMDVNEIAVFNHDQISSIYHLGLIDEEEENFEKKLETIMSEENDNLQPAEEEASISTNPSESQVPPTVEVPVPAEQPAMVQPTIEPSSTSLVNEFPAANPVEVPAQPELVSPLSEASAPTETLTAPLTNEFPAANPVEVPAQPELVSPATEASAPTETLTAPLANEFPAANPVSQPGVPLANTTPNSEFPTTF